MRVRIRVSGGGGGGRNSAKATFDSCLLFMSFFLIGRSCRISP
jgi:hypothetical protein